MVPIKLACGRVVSPNHVQGYNSYETEIQGRPSHRLTPGCLFRRSTVERLSLKIPRLGSFLVRCWGISQVLNGTLISLGESLR